MKGKEVGWQEGFGDLGTEDRRRRLGMAWGISGFWFDDEESGMEDWYMG